MSKALLAFNGAALLGCAIFISESENTVLTALLIFLPFLDKNFRQQISHHRFPEWLHGYTNYALVLVIICYLILLFTKSSYEGFAISIIFLTALPEEWFFRYYFLQQLERFSDNKWLSNSICSVLFAVMHIPSQGYSGLLVFFSSLFFGYVYQKSRSLILIVLLHGLANLFYVMYLQSWFPGFIR